MTIVGNTSVGGWKKKGNRTELAGEHALLFDKSKTNFARLSLSLVSKSHSLATHVHCYLSPVL